MFFFIFFRLYVRGLPPFLFFLLPELSETRLVYGNSLVDRVAKGARRGSCKTLKSEIEETLIRQGVSDKTLSAGICGAWPRASRAGERTGTSAIVRSGAQHASGGTRTTRRDRVIEADDILVRR
ncbi:hypothetical protein MY8738_002636, partial [Beauveria namnaoensis]